MHRSLRACLAASLVMAVGGCSGQEPASSPSAAVPTSAAPEQESPGGSPQLEEALLSSRLTVLVMGTDVNEERASAGEPVNTDSIMVTSISADQSEISVVSLPRDTVDIPMPDGSTWDRKVNMIYAEEGPEAVAGAVGALFEVEIDHYVALDMDDFVALVDAVGGVEVEVAERVAEPAFDFALDPGEHHLEGIRALHFAQTRTDSDHARSARQQQLLLALVDKLADPETEVDLEQLLDRLDSLETDLPLDELPTLMELARRAQDADVTREVLQPPRFAEFEGETPDRGWVMIPNVEEMRAFVGELMGD